MTVRVPKYRLHKGSGQALVEIAGRRIYLGRHNSDESRERYRRLIAELMSPQQVVRVETPRVSLRINHLILRYYRFAKTYYVKNGHSTSEPENIVLAIRPLLEMFGRTPASQFGPKSLKLVRQKMIHRGWVRKHINRQTDRIKRMFKWAVAEELIPAGIYEALRAVVGLRFGRCGAPDNPPVQSAPVDRVEAAKRLLNRQVATMLELQLLTGARPGEIVIIRPKDIDRSGEVWIYRPDEHKTQHHGHDRLIFLGPQAQRILAPFLLRAPEAHCFSPADAEKERREANREHRVTPTSCGNNVGTNRKEQPHRAPKDRYTTGSYRRAIVRVIEKAFPLPESLPKRHKGETLKAWKARMTDEQRQQFSVWRKSCWWHPHQLRHNYATMVRHKYGLEAAQVLLGHSKADVTQIYAERDLNNATQVAAKIG